MKIASLFSGSGALDYGLEQAGHELVLLCENDAGARQVLKQAFPGVLIIDDVAGITSLPEDTELLVAGFPCIDVSRAGNRKGLEGINTGLVRHIFRLLKKAKDGNRPIPWVLLENVEALLDRHGTSGDPVISYITQQIMELGYGSWAYRMIASAGFGLPNRRRRLFIVASLHGDARDVLLAQGTVGCQGGCEAIFGPGKSCYNCHMAKLRQREESDDEDITFAVDLSNAMSAPGEDVVPTFTTGNNKMLISLPDGRRGLLRAEDAERLQGLPTNWTLPCYPLTSPGMAVPRGIRQGNVQEQETQLAKRWDLLGNAVTVPVARWLGERLAAPYAYKYHGIGVHDRQMDHLWEQGVSHTSKEPNIWNFVSADSMQEAILFPYAVNEEGDRSDINNNVSDEHEIDNTNTNTKKKTGNTTTKTSRKPDPGTVAMEAAAEAEAIAMDNNNVDPDHSDDVAVTTKDVFQASVLDRIKKGSISTASRAIQSPWDRGSWPRCAWWVKGLGAFAVGNQISESPVLMPYQPLGEFIMEGDLGRPPTDEECNSYVNRLKQRGWQFSSTLMWRLSPNIEIKSGVRKAYAEIHRLPGLLSDAAMVGSIVWAFDPKSKLYWPAEVIDPLNPAAGKALPTGAAEMLNSNQRKASLPSEDGSYDPMKESAANRRVVAVFLPLATAGSSSQWTWANPADLAPFGDPSGARHEDKAEAALADSNFKYKEQLTLALKDARSSFALQTGETGRDVERMRRTRAAAAAAAVDLKKRCGQCKTCVSTYPGTRRYDCLTQRMKAAALSGHAGAQIAVCGAEAAGAEVSVWWDGNAQYYKAIVCCFDPFTTEHILCYEDGEIGIHRLWQHDERIQTLNQPEDWPAKKEVAVKKLQSAHNKLMHRRQSKDTNRKLAAVEAGVAEHAAGGANAQDTMHIQQQRIIAKSKAMMNLISGDGSIPAPLPVTPPSKTIAASEKKSTPLRSVAPAPHFVSQTSLQGLAEAAVPTPEVPAPVVAANDPTFGVITTNSGRPTSRAAGRNDDMVYYEDSEDDVFEEKKGGKRRKSGGGGGSRGGRRGGRGRWKQQKFDEFGGLFE